MKFSPLPCYLVPLRPKYSPQHPILNHPQTTQLTLALLNQCRAQLLNFANTIF
jgi:hypothetical protein